MNRLRVTMLKKRITQRELAEATGISQGEISRIVNGKRVRLDTAKRIARALGKSVDYLWPD